MPTPIHHTLGEIELPRGMIWSDEFAWTSIEKSTEYSVTGALLVDAATRQAGQPVTLKGDSAAGWVQRSVLQAVIALAESDPAGVHFLTLADGRSFDVQFAPGNPVDAAPVARPELPPDSYPYVATVRLIKV